MKRFILILFLVTSFAASSNAQKRFDVEQFKKERMEFLVKEIGLTEQEQKKFAPLCNELLDKKFELNREFRHKSREIKKKGKAATDTELQSLNDLNAANKIKEAELDKEYYDKFKTFLSAEKINKYYAAERKFMKRTVRDNPRK